MCTLEASQGRSLPIDSMVFTRNCVQEYRNTGNTGLQVSVLGFGTWVTLGYQLDLTKAKDIIQTAYDGGINL